MNRFAILGVVALFVCVGWAWSEQRVQSPSPAATSWEYWTLGRVAFPSLDKEMWVPAKGEPKIPDGAGFADALTIAGKSGWELVAIDHSVPEREPYTTTFYFKRPMR